MSPLDQVSIPGGWSERKVQAGEHSIRLLLPADPDRLLDELEEGDNIPSEFCDPYWAQLWPPATKMADWVARRQWPANLDAIELGCGIGLVGVAAAVAGMNVTLSDYVEMAVRLAEENARRNGVADRTRGLQLDWFQPVEQQFPLILGSDILYDKNLHECLVNLLSKMLTTDGECWISDPGRYHTSKFTDLAASDGLKVEIQNEHGQVLPETQSNQFQLIRLRR